ncbi:DNA helicase [Anaerocolumna chitinilytica]|jgi:hypothetical protein|uniref:Uncharacterized protein n=1 Tax=Anaerocolumna chitinilytica TaxID=1727145 RepID=A0A7M3SAU4_9FIRM|nr:DNA helicase [Anaerocolumna chitinilytica]BCK01712.1 hypothetical protein bsdcttw_47520 [Anaerocolumna chitinilytica]
MIQEIKIIIENYLNNAKLSMYLTGTVVADGIQISDRLTLPLELIQGNLKKELTMGKQVRLLRNHGGQQYYLLEVVE